MMTGVFLWNLEVVLAAQALEDSQFLSNVAAKVPDHYSKQTIAVLRRLLAPDPRTRPAIQFLLKKPYMKKWMRPDKV
jgi:hypothetical protein